MLFNQRYGKWWHLLVLIILVAVPIIKVNPFTKPLFWDGGVFVYIAQQISTGYAPYLTAFDHKTPLFGLVGALFISAGRLISLSDILAIRFGAFLLTVVHVCLLFWLVKKLTKSTLAAYVSAIFLAGFSGYADINASWIDPKSVLLLTQTALICCMFKGRYFLAGVCSILCGLAWQPGFMLCALAPFAFLIASSHTTTKVKPLLFFAAGSAVCVAFFLTYIILSGALKDFFDQAFLFNFAYYIPEKLPSTILAQLQHIESIIFRFYGPEVWEFHLALTLLPVFAVITFKFRAESPAEDKTKTTYALVLFTATGYLLIAQVNFASGPHLLPFLDLIPLINILTAWTLWQYGIKKLKSIKPFICNKQLITLRQVTMTGIVVLSVGISFRHLPNKCETITLQQQQDWINKVLTSGQYKTVQVVGASEFLVLANLRNLTKYLYFYNGVADFQKFQINQVQNMFASEKVPDIIVVARNGGNPFQALIESSYTQIDSITMAPDDIQSYDLKCIGSWGVTTLVYKRN